MVEAVVALMALLSIWVAVTWLSRLQDIALHAQHASAYGAFALTRNPLAAPVQEIKERFFYGPAHQWSDRQGRPLFSSLRGEIGWRKERVAALGIHQQPGGGGAYASALRNDWHVEDTGVATSHVYVAPENSVLTSSNDPSVAGLRYFDSIYPTLHRHTAILTGDAHASGDLATQDRVALSPLAWSRNASDSIGAGARVDAIMRAVDAGWNRPRPVFEWLDPWATHVPERHLNDNNGGHRGN